MQPTVSNAFVLLVIGMITVVVVLSLVVLSGKLLIRLTNKYAPEPEDEYKSVPLKVNHQLDPRIIAAISGVVEHITGGSGNITSIKKIK